MYGLFCRAHAPDTWHPITTLHDAAVLPQDWIVLGATMSACLRILHQRYPAADLRLSRLPQVDGDSWCAVRMRAPHEHYYPGMRLYECKDIAQKFPNEHIHCNITMLAGEAINIYKYDPAYNLRATTNSNNQQVITRITYYPAHAQQPGNKERKKAKPRKPQQYVRCATVCKTMYALHTAMRQQLPTIRAIHVGNYSRYTVCYNFLEVLRYFSLVFGAGSYREHASFQKLIAEWKVTANASRIAFLPTSQDIPSAIEHQDACLIFCNMMDSEARRKPASIRTAKQWKLIGTFPSFKSYCKAPRTKKLKAANV